MSKNGAIFIMPRDSSAWRGAEALWITVAGWAAAAERKYGRAWVITTDRTARADEVARYPLGSPGRQGMSTRFGFIPRWLKTLGKDILLLRARNTNAYADEVWENRDVAFVWEQHDLFSGPGHTIAARLGVPLVLYVHAPAVWESAKWGVRRPVWGKLLEYFFERVSLRRADLVACVSEQVAEKLRAMGVEPSRIFISPMAVDPVRFQSPEGASVIRERYKLQDRLVVGWTGSFRGFHGLGSLLKVFAAVIEKTPQAVFMLVGDGKEKTNIEKTCVDLGIADHVIFTGRIGFDEIPNYVSAFDIAVVSTSSSSDFHYSPLKLREYLAAGKAVLAPSAGEIPTSFTDEQHLLLYEVGDDQQMEDKMNRLLAEAGLRARLGESGRQRILERGTWDYELDRVSKALSILDK